MDEPAATPALQHAFAADKHGRVNREAIFKLRRLDINDERWRRAQRAIDDSVRVEGSKAHVRLYMRPEPDGKWQMVPINIAADWQDPNHTEAT